MDRFLRAVVFDHPIVRISNSCALLYWVAVKEFKVNYHNMDIKQIVWFLNHGSLTSVPEQSPSLCLSLPKGSLDLPVVFFPDDGCKYPT